MEPGERRAAVRYLRVRYAVSERRACGLLGVGRSTIRYQGRPRDDAPLCERLRALATERLRFGYRRLKALLDREGRSINHKRVYRLDRTEGLTLRRRKRKRGLVTAVRSPPLVPRQISAGASTL